MLIKHNRKQFIPTVILGLVIFLIATVYCDTKDQPHNINGVIILNSQTLQQALTNFPNLVVYFSASTCSYCGEMDLSYAIIEEKFRKGQQTKQLSKIVVFAKVLYDDQPEIFKKYSVTDAPTIKLFSHGVMQNIDYDCLDYNQEAILYTLEWVKRAVEPVKEISQAPAKVEKTTVVYPCKFGSESQLNKLRIRDVYTDYFCTKNLSILSTDTKIKIYSSIFPNGEQYSIPQTQIGKNIQKIIFRHKGLMPWDNYAIRNIFYHKHNAIVLLTNQDDYSLEMKIVIEKIRIQQNITEMFVIGNLSENLQEISKIKEYIGVPLKALYPFPLLVYLSHQNDSRIAKYSYNKGIDDYIEDRTQEKSITELEDQIKFNKEDIQDWLRKAIKGEARQHFRTMTKIEFKIPQSPTQSITRLAYSDLPQLFDKKHDLQFFIYITWRNDYFCNNIEGQIVDGWEDLQASKYTNMYTLGYNNNDILSQFQSLIKRLPALLYVDVKKETVYTDKIGTYEDVAAFVNANYKKVQIKQAKQQSSEVKPTEEVKISEKKASHVETNIDHLNVMKINKHKGQKNQKDTAPVQDQVNAQKPVDNQVKPQQKPIIKDQNQPNQKQLNQPIKEATKPQQPQTTEVKPKTPEVKAQTPQPKIPEAKPQTPQPKAPQAKPEAPQPKTPEAKPQTPQPKIPQVKPEAPKIKTVKKQTIIPQQKATKTIQKQPQAKIIQIQKKKENIQRAQIAAQ